MSLTKTAVFHPVIALTLTIAVVLGGLVSYTALGLEQTPQLNIPGCDGPSHDPGRKPPFNRGTGHP